eukprot:3365476-Pyramimonas_sp.AAC.1
MVSGHQSFAKFEITGSEKVPLKLSSLRARPPPRQPALKRPRASLGLPGPFSPCIIGVLWVVSGGGRLEGSGGRASLVEGVSGGGRWVVVGRWSLMRVRGWNSSSSGSCSIRSASSNGSTMMGSIEGLRGKACT